MGCIVSKFAFIPPEPSSYSFDPYETDIVNETMIRSKYRLHLSEKYEWQFTDNERKDIEVFYTSSTSGNNIACMFIRCSPKPRFYILFAHGNATDLGEMSCFYRLLGNEIDCNIFSFDYSGYGESTGKPSETNLYADTDAAWHELTTRYKISGENILLYGQSLGSAAIIDLATRYEVAAIILHSPLMSGIRILMNCEITCFFDPFPSIDKIHQIRSPVLVIHGTEDEVVPLSHGEAIHQKCSNAVKPLWIEGAGHNNISGHGQYIERLKQFVSVDLVNKGLNLK